MEIGSNTVRTRRGEEVWSSICFLGGSQDMGGALSVCPDKGYVGGCPLAWPLVSRFPPSPSDALLTASPALRYMRSMRLIGVFQCPLRMIFVSPSRGAARTEGDPLEG